MKKIIFLIAVLTAALSLVSCDGGEYEYTEGQTIEWHEAEVTDIMS